MSHAAVSTLAFATAPAIVRGQESYDAAIQPSNLPEEYLPREVRIRNQFGPYEVHVDPGQFALYWTLPEQKAIRYAVGIGRPGLY